MQKKDPLFYVLFGGNTKWIAGMIEESVLNVAREYPDEGVAEALQLMRPAPDDPLTSLQIKFFALLNEDERMRCNLACVKSPTMVSLCPHKAERFYDALSDELMPMWVKDERVSDEEFLDKIRQGYLCS